MCGSGNIKFGSSGLLSGRCSGHVIPNVGSSVDIKKGVTACKTGAKLTTTYRKWGFVCISAPKNESFPNSARNYESKDDQDGENGETQS